VSDWSERALVGAGLLSSFELDLDEVGDELLGLDVRQLDGAFDFSRLQDLLLEEVGEGVEQGVAPWGEEELDLGVNLELLLEFGSLVL